MYTGDSVRLWTGKVYLLWWSTPRDEPETDEQYREEERICTLGGVNSGPQPFFNRCLNFATGRNKQY